MPAVYIDEFVGLSNRLEALPLAFALAKHYGHEVVLDWRELDGFDVLGAKAGKLWPWRKWGAVRVRDCTLRQFHALQHKPVICRSLDGPSEMLDPIYLEVAQRVRPKRHVLHGILNALVPYAHKPMVAVHIRQGDYALKSHTQYQTDVEWPAVPLPLYAAAMHQWLQHQPDAVFLVAHNGPSAPVQEALQGLPVVQLGISSPYAYKGPDHASNVHPMADLYALAACSVLIATPISGYSHWAANVLGGPSLAIVPRPGCTVEKPQFGMVQCYGKRMNHWRHIGRTGVGVQWLEGGMQGLPLASPPNLSWLFGLLNASAEGSFETSAVVSMEASPNALAWATVQLRGWHPQVPKTMIMLGECKQGLALLQARQAEFQAMLNGKPNALATGPAVWIVLHAPEHGEQKQAANHSKLVARQWRTWHKVLMHNHNVCTPHQELSQTSHMVLMVDWVQYLGLMAYAEMVYTDDAGHAELISSMGRNVQLVSLA